MGTTTFETIRTTQLSTIEGISPSLVNEVKFLRHREEDEFREWCETNPQAAFRRFSVRDLFNDVMPEITNLDVELVVGSEEVVIAYPEDFRYPGLDGTLALHDVIRSDKFLINKKIGAGATVYTDAHAVMESWSIENGEGIMFSVFNFTFRYNRSV